LWHAPLAIEAALRGQGVALANDFIVGDELATGELVEVIRSNVKLEPYSFVTRSDRWGQPDIARFRSWLLKNVDRPGTDRAKSK
jgi:DNA-binding transcriptional LysR family regulator